jgi:hypothetical protein
MPRFYFHTRRHGESLSNDEFGLDFPDAVSAHDEILRAVRNLDVAFAVRGKDPRDCTIEVENASGELAVGLSLAAIFSGQAKEINP